MWELFPFIEILKMAFKDYSEILIETIYKLQLIPTNYVS
ncbi:hypothetical protein LEP1GSC083_4475 [Leptospira interrogans serovar Pyrogenes str. L0374]|uniref:Uncharacterized protein n=2 Tax=Leptospira interrogans serovar Pyrogenes TaxID=280500 RepID=M7A4S4_LEPIR|nr:hypothetical protein LEP1GSC077_1948 [Leptospira interrogans str. C10069]EKR16581.1 hypothetical protein LEP1GSC019_1538 [Leptospira interrogans serovar Pyrogenes str. 2006006960]EMF71965.1 hypothetical protein LEP1GSC148_2500 [Leptospira interrogans serovar Canicola str. LT1962]EMM90587.1 hypothetical protein LEP1GSC145_3323 [Leptospira interrogans serovar Djasiman str. LT1649]EMN28929.1 hypothetical protein LEP1GSC083_4475 [Leptospira interrogans serovar Pyrogenes str. L0374]EMN47184.1 hy